MLDHRISDQQYLDAFRHMREELLLQIKMSLETIEECQKLLRHVNAQIDEPLKLRTHEKSLDPQGPSNTSPDLPAARR